MLFKKFVGHGIDYFYFQETWLGKEATKKNMIKKAIGISTTREIPAKIRTFRIIKVKIIKIMADQISKFAGENFPCLARLD